MTFYTLQLSSNSEGNRTQRDARKGKVWMHILVLSITSKLLHCCCFRTMRTCDFLSQSLNPLLHFCTGLWRSQEGKDKGFVATHPTTNDVLLDMPLPHTRHGPGFPRWHRPPTGQRAPPASSASPAHPGAPSSSHWSAQSPQQTSSPETQTRQLSRIQLMESVSWQAFLLPFKANPHLALLKKCFWEFLQSRLEMNPFYFFFLSASQILPVFDHHLNPSQN